LSALAIPPDCLDASRIQAKKVHRMLRGRKYRKLNTKWKDCSSCVLNLCACSGAH
jgi:hypothetical protein